MFDGTYDYIIIGAGSAGCVLANRLSADGDVSVLLVEAGPRDSSWQIAMPLGFVSLLQSNRFNWDYHSAEEVHLAQRRLYCPGGRVLGGSSSINGMIHVRAHAEDFLRWQQMGAQSWAPEVGIEYAKRSETYLGRQCAHRGDSGPIKVAPAIAAHSLDEAFLAASDQLGLPNDRDFNGEHQEGFGCYDQAIVRGRRFSVADAYLRPILHRNNLTLVTATRVRRVLIERERCTGIEWWHGGGKHQARCHNEVIISAGAIGSPHLLQLSGIGDSEWLQRLDIATNHHLPAVGQGLQNHVEAVVQYECTQPITIAPFTRGLGKALSGARWFLDNGGICATNHWHVGAFLRTENASYPDVQLIFCPVSLGHGTLEATPWHGFQIHAGFQKPISRGYVKCLDSNPDTPPEIRMNCLSHAEDRAGLRSAVKYAREVVSSPAFDQFRGAEMLPGESVRTNDALDRWLSDYAENSFHLTSSCRMGLESSSDVVVNDACQVIGLQGLRVVDASVMPEIVNANPHATVLMIAEWVAELITANR